MKAVKLHIKDNSILLHNYLILTRFSVLKFDFYVYFLSLILNCLSVVWIGYDIASSKIGYFYFTGVKKSEKIVKKLKIMIKTNSVHQPHTKFYRIKTNFALVIVFTDIYMYTMKG